MTYDAIEKSVDDAIRVEIYTFELPGVTYRLTDFDEDVLFGGVIYAATPLSRGQVPLVPLGKVRELTVSLALDHVLAVNLRTGGIPPRDAAVTIRSFFLGDPESRLVWQGFIALASTDDQYTRLTIPNRIDEAFDCQIPILTAQIDCPHMLYDTGCGVDPVVSGSIITPTASSVSGTTIVVSSISGKPDGWATFGKVRRIVDGEERSIISQTGTTVEIDVPFRALSNGDALEVYRGCAHTVDACVDDFNNILNYGGDPDMPIGNPSAPTGYGVASQV